MPRRSTGPTNRNLLNHGNGKGSADRTTDRQAYLRNLGDVNFPNSEEGFVRKGPKRVKLYGASSPPRFDRA
jgi:hypothetical protein